MTASHDDPPVSGEEFLRRAAALSARTDELLARVDEGTARLAEMARRESLRTPTREFILAGLRRQERMARHRRLLARFWPPFAEMVALGMQTAFDAQVIRQAGAWAEAELRELDPAYGDLLDRISV